MKAVVHVNHAEHQKTHGSAIRRGLERHGISVQFAQFNQPKPCDLAVIWGWKQKHVIEAAPLTLVMERGHVQPRMDWTSCGFNGLGGRARYPEPMDAGDRWYQHFAHHLQPWRNGGDRVLLCGQVAGDASLYGLKEGFQAWAQNMTDALLRRGYQIDYRPHPLNTRRGNPWCPAGAMLSLRPLAADIKRAAFAVTFNSTVGVETVLAGVPTITFDEGAMAWPVTTHDLDADPVTPDRADWCKRLAWTQWTMNELSDGTAVEALKTCWPS